MNARQQALADRVGGTVVGPSTILAHGHHIIAATSGTVRVYSADDGTRRGAVVAVLGSWQDPTDKLAVAFWQATMKAAA